VKSYPCCESCIPLKGDQEVGILGSFAHARVASHCGSVPPTSVKRREPPEIAAGGRTLEEGVETSLR